jgi:adenosylhomocysteine nucleosidase
MSIATATTIVVLISANAEWTRVKEALKPAHVETSSYGEFFVHVVAGVPVVFLHGGWGKVAAAASTEYAIGRWQPELLINLGTCGGVQGRVERYEILLVTKTLVSDIYEAMGDSAAAIAHYTTTIDLEWLGPTFPLPVRRAPLASADRDLTPREIPVLVEKHGAIAADWESGAIAHVAKRRGVRLIILRGVSDLVGPNGGEAIGNLGAFEKGAAIVMTRLLDGLPRVIEHVRTRLPSASPAPR